MRAEGTARVQRGPAAEASAAAEVRGAGTEREWEWEQGRGGTAWHGTAAAGCRPAARVAAPPHFPCRVARPAPSAAARRGPAETRVQLRGAGRSGWIPQGKGGHGERCLRCISAWGRYGGRRFRGWAGGYGGCCFCSSGDGHGVTDSAVRVMDTGIGGSHGSDLPCSQGGHQVKRALAHAAPGCSPCLSVGALVHFALPLQVFLSSCKLRSCISRVLWEGRSSWPLANMVVFTCNACGEAVKKAQVEKHVNICRNCQCLSCMDCGKDFWYVKGGK